MTRLRQARRVRRNRRINDEAQMTKSWVALFLSFVIWLSIRLVIRPHRYSKSLLPKNFGRRLREEESREFTE